MATNTTGLLNIVQKDVAADYFDVFTNLIVEMKLYLSSAWVSSQVPRCRRCPTKKLEMLVGPLICNVCKHKQKSCTKENIWYTCTACTAKESPKILSLACDDRRRMSQLI